MEELEMHVLSKYRYLPLLLIVALAFTGCDTLRVAKTPPVPPPPPPVMAPPQTPAPPPRPKVEPTKEWMSVDGLKTVYFDYDRFDLRPDAVAVLNNNLNWFKNHPDVDVRIEGNCDERGSEQYNQVLGEKRANTVRGWLISQGVDGNRLHTESLGESNPAVPGHNEAAWAQNRRDEFKAYLTKGEMR